MECLCLLTLLLDGDERRNNKRHLHCISRLIAVVDFQSFSVVKSINLHSSDMMVLVSETSVFPLPGQNYDRIPKMQVFILNTINKTRGPSTQTTRYYCARHYLYAISYFLWMVSRPGVQLLTSRALSWIQCKLGKPYLWKKILLPCELNPSPNPNWGSFAVLHVRTGPLLSRLCANTASAHACRLHQTKYVGN
mgnify:CR=1 FL=1